MLSETAKEERDIVQSLSTAGTVQKQLKETLSEEFLEILKLIAYNISEMGLSLEESCLLQNVDYMQFSNLMQKNTLIARLISIKELEYKRSILKALVTKAKGGDDKMSQWLLERQFPNQFGSVKRGSTPQDRDILFEAIEFVQNSSDSSPLVGSSSHQDADKHSMVNIKKRFRKITGKILKV